MRGYQKKVVYLKNIDSAVFEEAYFIIKSNLSEASCKKNKESLNLVKEANRIIEENTDFSHRSNISNKNIKNILFFLIGFLLSSSIFLLYLFV